MNKLNQLDQLLIEAFPNFVSLQHLCMELGLGAERLKRGIGDLRRDHNREIQSDPALGFALTRLPTLPLWLEDLAPIPCSNATKFLVILDALEKEKVLVVIRGSHNPPLHLIPLEFNGVAVVGATNLNGIARLAKVDLKAITAFSATEKFYGSTAALRKFLGCAA